MPTSSSDSFHPLNTVNCLPCQSIYPKYSQRPVTSSRKGTRFGNPFTVSSRKRQFCRETEVPRKQLTWPSLSLSAMARIPSQMHIMTSYVSLFFAEPGVHPRSLQIFCKNSKLNNNFNLVFLPRRRGIFSVILG